MSCITAKATVFDGHIEANIVSINEGINVSFKAINEGINARCCLVCSTITDNYLFVSPDIIWLTPDMLNGEFIVKSNTDWVIELNKTS